MKFGSIFWAIYLIVLGLILLIKVIFRLDFSWTGAAFALLLLMSGISLITNGARRKKNVYRPLSGVQFFANGTVILDEETSEFTSVFSDAEIELSRDRMPKELAVNSLFGRTILRVPEGYSARVEGTAVFGVLELPEGQIPAFGDKTCIVGDGLQIKLRVTSIFGYARVMD